MDIKVKRGTVGILKLVGLIDENLKFHSNAPVMALKPVFKHIVDGELFSTLLVGNPNEITFKVDCTHCQSDFILYQVTNQGVPLIVTLERNITTALSQQSIKAVDLEMIRDATESHQHYFPKVASDNAGFDVVYYQAVTLTGYPVISADILKSITDAKPLTVLFPKGGMYENIDWDQFGLKYEQLTNIHVVRQVWAETGFAGQPEPDDIIYMPIANQFFKVTSVTMLKSVANRVNVFELTLGIVTDNENIETQEDILDLTGLVEAGDILAPELEENTLVNQVLFDYGIQRLQLTELVDIEGFSQQSWVYGIVFYQGQWLKYKGHNDIQTLTTLTNTPVASPVPVDYTWYFAKLVVVNSMLDTITETMYYTSISLPPDIKPLHLLQHVTRKPRN